MTAFGPDDHDGAATRATEADLGWCWEQPSDELIRNDARRATMSAEQALAITMRWIWLVPS